MLFFAHGWLLETYVGSLLVLVEIGTGKTLEVQVFVFWSFNLCVHSSIHVPFRSASDLCLFWTVLLCLRHISL